MNVPDKHVDLKGMPVLLSVSMVFGGHPSGNTWPAAVFSKTLLIFYLSLIVVILFLTFGVP